MEYSELLLQPTMAGFAARMRHHRNSPRAKSAAIREGNLHLELATGATIIYPARTLRLLAPLTDEELSGVIVTAGGTTLMWPKTENQIGIGVEGLLEHITGLVDNRTIARKGGSVSTPDKAAAARANGAKGGRPRKVAPAKSENADA